LQASDDGSKPGGVGQAVVRQNARASPVAVAPATTQETVTIARDFAPDITRELALGAG
jgi:hypothetical protein